jgi:hypothetical protein
MSRQRPRLGRSTSPTGLAQRQDAARLGAGLQPQAVTNDRHIVIAAEITADSPDFGHLAPMVNAAEGELAAVGVTDRPEVVLADAGYRDQDQIEAASRS